MIKFPHAQSMNIGQVVCTAGVVDLDLEDQHVSFNRGEQRTLPPGYNMVLKDIDEDGMAYLYHHTNGVMKMPAVLLLPTAATG